MRCYVILALLLLGGCSAMPATGQLQKEIATSVEAERAYDVQDVLGVGPVFAAKLAKSGINTTDQLLANTKTTSARQRLAQRADIPYGSLLHLARKVDLMQIKGVGPRQSNLLEAIGVASIKDLAQRNLDSLYERLIFANHIGRPFVKVDPAKTQVDRWMREARQLLSAGKAIEE
ncbi:MAG: DUF4332 domain-containing protein [Cyanobacteria bacterium NC_groundwater_1444_Ag_S-0.65um_54_12]|nr:DUF4332 domain-containing protein [Cyanobacteria bacterium NC_groundwater_1444_Ag_S-0.65um_54_12]